MIKKALLLVTCLLSISSFCFALNTNTIVERTIIPYMKELQIPGMAIVVYDGTSGQIICYGKADIARSKPVTPETIFEIASITKVFTATELAYHVLNGHLQLNDKIGNYLPGLGPLPSQIKNVTFLQLATHSSSLPRMAPALQKGKIYNKEMVMQFLQQWKSEYPLGTKYLYSNLGFGLIGYALENMEGATYEGMLTKDLLYPLGMHSTWVTVPPNQMHRYAQGYGPKSMPKPKFHLSPLPAGGALRSTAADMQKFLEANLDILGPENILEAIRFAQKPYFKVNDRLTMGLGWQRVMIDDVLLIDKNGGLPGFSSYIGMLPRQKIGVVILANKSKIQSTKIGRELLKRLASESQPQPNQFRKF